MGKSMSDKTDAGCSLGGKHMDGCQPGTGVGGKGSTKEHMKGYGPMKGK